MGGNRSRSAAASSPSLRIAPWARTSSAAIVQDHGTEVGGNHGPAVGDRQLGDRQLGARPAAVLPFSRKKCAARSVALYSVTENPSAARSRPANNASP